jgi:hypothetical protein
MVAIGVTWLLLARHRRTEAVGQALVGIGLLVHGLHTVQLALAPILGDAQVLARMVELEGSGGALLARAGLGAAAALVGQGAGPAIGLAVGIARETGGFALGGLLEFASGAALGGALGAAVVVAPARRSGRLLAAATVALWLVGALALLLLVPAWQSLAELFAARGARSHVALAGATAVAYGAVGLSLSLAAVGWLRWRHHAAASAPPLDEEDGRRGLVAVLHDHRRALEATARLIVTGARSHGVDAEDALAASRESAEQLHARARSSALPPPLIGATAAALQTQRALEQLHRLGELVLERALVIDKEDAHALADHQWILIEGVDELIATLEKGAVPDLEAARTREIRLNAEEARRRGKTTSGRARSETGQIQIGTLELFDAYENVGNKLFRIYEALAAHPLDAM